MSWALVDSKSGHVPGASTDNVVLTVNASGADMIAWFAATYQDGSYPTLTDNQGTTSSWVQKTRADGGGGNRHLQSWYLFNPVQATYTITIDTAGGGNFCSAGGGSFSGSSGVFGTQAALAGTVLNHDCKVVDASGVTASEDSMLIVGAAGSDAGYTKAFDITGGSTWDNTSTNNATQAVPASSGAYVGFVFSYRILGVGTSGNQYGVWFTEPGFTGVEAGVSIMSFKMASAGPTFLAGRGTSGRRAVPRASLY